MVFSSLIFVFLFLPLVLVIYFGPLRKHRHWQNAFLTIVSLVFYAWGEPIFSLIMLGLILIDWLFGLALDKFKGQRKAKLLLIAALIINLSVLFVYKYLNFAAFNLTRLFGLELNVPQIALPIGISFFTFQAISYIIDVYRGTGVAQRNPIHVCLYISLFPQLIAGPIVRYQSIAEQILGRCESLADFTDGIMRFVIGLSKKVLLANTLAIVADAAFSTPLHLLPVQLSWLGALAYSMQLYYDFSGYSDMAIGLGKMFGFHFQENFDHPYLSASVSEFWRRWHISLGSWFRDYVYFPMGGSRVSKSRLVFNLFVVWLLTGIWHGASWTFVIWGLYLCALITVEKLCFRGKPRGALRAVSHIYVLLAVIVGWVIFRSSSVMASVQYLKVMAGLSGNVLSDSLSALYLKENLWYFIIGIAGLLPLSIIIKKINVKAVEGYLYPAFALLLFLVCMSYLAKGAYNPFIYFNF